MRLLIVEDAGEVAEALAVSFERKGDAVDCAATLAEARDSLAGPDYDLIVLDIELPDGDAMTLLRDLRAKGSTVPVIILTARAGVEARVLALDAGADDYITKPFDLREVQARARSVLRRSHGEAGPVARMGRLTLDPASRLVTVDGKPLVLPRREYALLEILIARRGWVVSKERLFDHMFAFREEEIGMNAIEVYVARLRRHLAGSGVMIRTLRGLGYQLVEEDR
ncbi:response regulator [Paracoccus sp. (in: a-proteobacteria)]|uniref:response regulator n=1 Tax=Paracoccus sp. TaxID=267 RepID=UPI003A8A50C0